MLRLLPLVFLIPSLALAQSSGMVSTTPGPRQIISLDIKTVTAANVAVLAINPGNRTAGGWIQNPPTATVNLCYNELSTAVGFLSNGDTTCIIPGQSAIISASQLGLSVISSDSNHPFSGYGLK